MNALLAEYPIRVGKALRGIVVARNDANFERGEFAAKPREKRAEELDGLRAWNGTIVDVSRDDEGRVVVFGERLDKLIQHDFLIFDQGGFMKAFSEMQVPGVEQFHIVYCKNIAEFCKGLL